MIKFKPFIDLDKEIEYLNHMASKGLFLKKYFTNGIYYFYRKEPKQVTYQIDYKKFNAQYEFESYIKIFEDAGWTHICGTEKSGLQYFLKENNNIGEKIFSDKESRASIYKELFLKYMILAVLWSLSVFSHIKYLDISFYQNLINEHPEDFEFGMRMIRSEIGGIVLDVVTLMCLLYVLIKIIKLYRKTLNSNEE